MTRKPQGQIAPKATVEPLRDALARTIRAIIDERCTPGMPSMQAKADITASIMVELDAVITAADDMYIELTTDHTQRRCAAMAAYDAATERLTKST